MESTAVEGFFFYFFDFDCGVVADDVCMPKLKVNASYCVFIIPFESKCKAAVALVLILCRPCWV